MNIIQCINNNIIREEDNVNSAERISDLLLDNSVKSSKSSDSYYTGSNDYEDNGNEQRTFDTANSLFNQIEILKTQLNAVKTSRRDSLTDETIKERKKIEEEVYN